MKTLYLILFIILSVNLSAQNRYDIVIDEIMADPSPQIGLPNNEWIELKNVSAVPVNLQGWRIGDVAGQSGPMPDYLLQPDSFIIVCPASAVPALSVFGAVISVTNFPSLNNEGEQLFLKDTNGRVIHAVEYSPAWYENEIKKEGGWSLEMIDTKSPCAGSGNWKAATDANGGTPGRINSVDAVNDDQTAPSLKNVYTLDSVTLIVVFDEPVDSIVGATVANYSIDGGPGFISAITLTPLFNTVQLKLNTGIQFKTVYTLTVNNVADCRGNIIAAQNTAKIGLPEDALSSDIVINEILFNPRPNSYDYVECYNRSKKIIDASKLYIANRNSSGTISSAKTVSASPVYIFPGDYITVTEDRTSLALNYFVKNQDKVFAVSPMPSFPDDAGEVVLLNGQGEPVDEVKYDARWHFKLIDNAEGVALERIDPAGPSQDAANWHSAASTAGYGTPTYINSQFKQANIADATIEISPKVFSPDNDGHDDIATIQYKLNERGYVANITIFDGAGRPVRVLVNNGTLALTGYWNWDGLNDKGIKLPIGTYIVYTEIFNLQGKKKHFKNAIVLARKLN
jgi:hypothetical protein